MKSLIVLVVLFSGCGLVNGRSVVSPSFEMTCEEAGEKWQRCTNTEVICYLHEEHVSCLSKLPMDNK